MPAEPTAPTPEDTARIDLEDVLRAAAEAGEATTLLPQDGVAAQGDR